MEALLGLDTDEPLEIPGIAGCTSWTWATIARIHLLGGDDSPYSAGPGRDPVEKPWHWRSDDMRRRPRLELRHGGGLHWKLNNVAAPGLMQLCRATRRQP